MSYAQKTFYQDGLPYVCSNLKTNLSYYAEGKATSYEIVPQDAQQTYARWNMWFIVVALFIRIVYRLWYKLLDRSKVRQNVDGILKLPFKLVAFLRYLGYRRIPYFSDLPVSVGHIFLVGSFYLFYACVLFIPHPWYRTCLQFDNPPVSVRAALMANSLIPFIYAFSGKSNIVSWLTGTSYEKLNVLHRMLAYLCFVSALIHMISIFYRAQAEGGSHFTNFIYWKQNGSMPVSGTIAIVLLFFLSSFSLKFVRERFYELFIILHWPVALAFLGIMYWHNCAAYESYMYLWTAMGILLSGYVHRFFVKSSYFRLNDQWFWTDRAEVTPVQNGALQLSISSAVTRFWSPGQHIFVRFTGLQPFGNHPFSIYNIPEHSGFTEGIAEMKFLINPQHGITKALAARAHASEEECQFKVSIDGPFGGVDRDITAFDSAVLIASGSGISAVLPFLSHYAHYKRTDMRSIHLLWVVKTSSRVRWVEDELCLAKRALPDNLHLHIHVSSEDSEASDSGTTSPSEQPLYSEDSQGEEKMGTDETLPTKDLSFPIQTTLPLLRGRPDIEQYLQNWSKEFGPRTLVFSCGVHEVLKRTANKVAKLQSNIFKGAKTCSGEAYEEIYLHSEVFDW